MTPKEIRMKLTGRITTVECLEAFYVEMQTKHYGKEEVNDAYHFFEAGWEAMRQAVIHNYNAHGVRMFYDFINKMENRK